MAKTTIKITVPFNYEPREYQIPFWGAIESGVKRILIVWHRRSGKDKTVVNIFPKAMLERVGAYYYFFPTYSQGRKVIWEGMDKNGYRFINHFPEELIESKNDTLMQIKFKNGSLFQIVGTENIDAIMGTNPVGCAFSEYSLQNPRVWDYIRPILTENDGWAVFLYTPRGENHAYDLHMKNANNPKWFVQILTADDTGVVSKEMIDEERASGMSEDMIQQEYYCSYTAAVLGAYYSNEMRQMRADKRITKVPYDPNLPVHTVWDLGVNDMMSVGFFQSIGHSRHMIDYEESSGKGLDYYAKVLKSKPYIYGKHFAPHDIKARELSTGKSRLEKAAALGINFEVVPKVSLMDGIDQARAFFSRVWIDEEKCAQFVRAIPNYTKKYDELRKVFLNTPEHNWASNPADMFRYAALVADQMSNDVEDDIPTPEPETVNEEYRGDVDPFEDDRHPMLKGIDIGKMG